MLEGGTENTKSSRGGHAAHNIWHDEAARPYAALLPQPRSAPDPAQRAGLTGLRAVQQ